MKLFADNYYLLPPKRFPRLTINHPDGPFCGCFIIGAYSKGCAAIANEEKSCGEIKSLFK